MFCPVIVSTPRATAIAGRKTTEKTRVPIPKAATTAGAESAAPARSRVIHDDEEQIHRQRAAHPLDRRGGPDPNDPAKIGEIRDHIADIYLDPANPPEHDY
jgi:hypothetical protein